MVFPWSTWAIIAILRRFSVLIGSVLIRAIDGRPSFAQSEGRELYRKTGVLTYPHLLDLNADRLHEGVIDDILSIKSVTYRLSWQKCLLFTQ